MKSKKAIAPAKEPAIAKAKVVTKKKLAEPVILQKFGLFNLKCPTGAHKKRKYLGRGSSSGHGKTSTRGSKGQTSRAGRHFYLGFEGGQSPLIRKMPKRGFTNIFKKEFQIVNLRDLLKLKETTINPELLAAKGLIKDQNKLVKILGVGVLKSALTVHAHAFSKKATEEIKKAGGKVEVIYV